MEVTPEFHDILPKQDALDKVVPVTGYVGRVWKR